MNNKYLQEAIRIGDQLLDLAEKDKHGISWQTIRRTSDYIDSWHKSYGLYWGVNGIVYFLTSLYSVTKDTKYLEASENAMRWVEWKCKEKEKNDYSLLDGDMSIAFVFLHLYKITSNKIYLAKALTYAKQ